MTLSQIKQKLQSVIEAYRADFNRDRTAGIGWLILIFGPLATKFILWTLGMDQAGPAYWTTYAIEIIGAVVMIFWQEIVNARIVSKKWIARTEQEVTALRVTNLSLRNAYQATFDALEEARAMIDSFGPTEATRLAKELERVRETLRETSEAARFLLLVRAENALLKNELERVQELYRKSVVILDNIKPDYTKDMTDNALESEVKRLTEELAKMRKDRTEQADFYTQVLVKHDRIVRKLAEVENDLDLHSVIRKGQGSLINKLHTENLAMKRELGLAPKETEPSCK